MQNHIQFLILADAATCVTSLVGEGAAVEGTGCCGSSFERGIKDWSFRLVVAETQRCVGGARIRLLWSVSEASRSGLVIARFVRAELPLLQS
jgi:hypothetical protein